ncbi:hypothetical protein HYDPIDRAFT_103105, partial [Hydnomerulius pinastri MD-312]
RQKVQHVWGRRWEVTRMVFTASRYLPFISAVMSFYGADTPRNALYTDLNLVFHSLSIIFAEGLLILRTHALWGRSRRLLIGLLALGTIRVRITVCHHLTPKCYISLLNLRIAYYPSACEFHTSRDGAFQYIFLMVYEMILQSLSSLKRFRFYRDVHSPTLSSLYWGSMSYMFWIIDIQLHTTSCSCHLQIAYIDSLDTAQLVIHSVLASRILFNLRESDQRVHDLGTETNLPLVTMNFNSPDQTGLAAE